MIRYVSHYQYRGPKPNFDRDRLKTVLELKRARDTDYDCGHIVFCIETQKHYIFNKNNSTDATLGKFREMGINPVPTEDPEGPGVKLATSIFVTNKPVNNPIGGFKKGDSFTEESNLSVNDALNMLLHKYEPPTTSISLTPSTPVYEAGVIVPEITVNLVVTEGSEPLKTVTLLKDGSVVANYTTAGTFEHKLTNIDKDTKIEVKTQSTNDVINREVKVSFISKSYYGTIGNDVTIDATVIKSLQNSRISLRGDLTYANIDMLDSKIVYAYPSKLGTISAVVDGNGYDMLSSFVKSTVDVDGTPYTVMVLEKQTTVDDYSVKFTVSPVIEPVTEIAK